jgi:hypothetical protein
MGKLTLGLITLLFSISVHGTTRYVDKNAGTCSGNYSFNNRNCSGADGNSYSTIAAGVQATRTGDKLYIRGGTYSEGICANCYTIPTGTSWTDAPLIAGYTGETVILSVGGGPIIGLAQAYIQYLNIENLILDGQRTSNEPISVGSSGSHHISFRKIEVKNTGHHGVFFHYPGHHFNFIDGKVHDIGNTTLFPWPATRQYGFYIETYDCVVENTEIYNVGDYGIHNYTGHPTTTSNNVFRGLRIHHTGLLEPSTAGIILSKGDNIRLYNSIIYANSAHGIQVSQSATNAKVYNNTVYGGNETGISIAAGTTGASVINNIFFGNRTYQIYNETTSGNTLQNNLTTDPKFAGAGTYDFHLTSASLNAINQATPLNNVFTTDIIGVSRGTSWDIGAYEFASGSAPSSPPQPPQNLKAQ